MRLFALVFALVAASRPLSVRELAAEIARVKRRQVQDLAALLEKGGLATDSMAEVQRMVAAEGKCGTRRQSGEES